MKKPYYKPQLFAESFELVEHISSCSDMGGLVLTHTDLNTSCYLPLPESGIGVQLFWDGNNNCTQPLDPEDEFNTVEMATDDLVCYISHSNVMIAS